MPEAQFLKTYCTPTITARIGDHLTLSEAEAKALLDAKAVRVLSAKTVQAEAEARAAEDKPRQRPRRGRRKAGD